MNSGVSRALLAGGLICLSFAPLFASAGDIPLVSSDDVRGTQYIDSDVRFDGRILDVFHDELNPEYTFALAEDAQGKVYIAIKADEGRLPNVNELVDAFVSVTGKCRNTVTGAHRPYLDRQVDIHFPSGLCIVKPADGQAFETPALNLKEDLPPDRLLKLGKRRLAGRVVAVRHKNNFLIRTPDGFISRIEQKGFTPPVCGEFVEAVGNVETDTHHINLSNAVWRPTEPQPDNPPPATNISARLLLQDGAHPSTVKRNFHGQLIRVEGTIRSLPVPDYPERVFFVECDGVTFPVDASAVPGALPFLQIGCKVRLDGICWMEIENWRPNAVFPHFKSFALVLRSSDDIRILAYPSWWTPIRLLAIILSLVAVIIGIAVWNLALQKVAERRGRQLFREKASRLESESKTAERSRLAVELHDSISQILTGVALKIKASQTQVKTDPEKALKNLNIAENTLRSSREELRYCLWDLRNNILDLPNLEDAIRQTLKPQTGDVELAVRFPVSHRKLSDNTIHIVLQIVRELAVNAIRHGAATSIRIAGSLDNGILAFSVQDNGSGFDQDSAPGPEQGHFGLLGVQDRLAHYDGTIDIQSAPGNGTKAIVRMTLSDDTENATS